MTTTPERWTRIGELFDAASAVRGDARDALLRDACADDVALEREVRSLLDAQERGSSFLERPAVERPGTFQAFHEPVDLIGRSIGPYRVESLLGTGGMGAVYQAHDSRLDRRVAIKALPEPVASDPGRISTLRREARAIAALSHPNVATIHGLEEAAGTVYLVLELVEGESLRETIARGPLSIQRSVALGAQVAAAIEAAHDRGVIHRDLKPGNVMVTPSDRVKVLDFGLARRLDSRPGNQPDEDGVLIGGTPGYMSPEQAEGLLQDERTDLFALGCLLYECVTGLRAFTGSAGTDTVTRSAPDMTRVPEDTPDALRQLIAACLSTAPSRRPDTIGIARETLERLAGAAAEPASRLRDGIAPERHNLPKQATSFIGRTDELDRLEAMLADDRLVTLTGVGGTGKTRLALQAGRLLLGRTRSAVRFVALASVRAPELVADAVAHALDLREGTGSQEQQISAALQDAPTVLILDNCEHLLGACASLAGSLLDTCPDLVILATSREGLGLDHERVLALAPLELPPTDAVDSATLGRIDSVRLFVDRAAQVRPGYQLTAPDCEPTRELCRRLDGVPLAIELAASRMRVLSPAQILRRLTDRFGLLRRAGSDDSTETHATLWRTIEWSHELLCDEERDLFAMMSIFEDGWSIDGAVAVSGLDEITALDLLTQLVEKSLVEVRYPASLDGEPRFSMLESIRDFASHTLAAGPDAQTARTRHGGFFLALALDAAPTLRTAESPRWMHRLESEHQNLLRALQDASASDGLRIATSITRFWESRGHLLIGQQAIEQLLARADETTPTDLLTRAAGNAATLAMHRGLYDDAEVLLTDALARERDRGTPEGLAITLLHTGTMWFFRGNPLRAREPFEEALEISERLGNTRHCAVARGNLANVHQETGDPERSCTMLEACLEDFRAIGDRRDTAIALGNLSNSLHLMGRIEEAEVRCRESLALSREINDQQCIGHALSHLAAFSLLRGDTPAARGVLAECLILLQRLGDHRQGAYAIESAAKLAQREGNDELALRLSGAADGVRESIGSQRAEHIEVLHTETITRASEQLDDTQQRITRQEGRDLGFEAASRLAVEWIDPDATLDSGAPSSLR